MLYLFQFKGCKPVQILLFRDPRYKYLNCLLIEQYF